MNKSPHLDPEWLRQKYVGEGLSTYDIGKLVGRDPKSIYEKLKAFGIPTRLRGENLKGSDNYMKHEGRTNPFLGRKHTAEAKEKLRVASTRPRPKQRGSGNGMYGRVGPLNPGYVDGSSPERQCVYVSAEWREVQR